MTKILKSDSGNYYEYDPNILPIREDAWGAYYKGKCYSDTDSCFISEVSICVVPDDLSDWIIHMWRHFGNTHCHEIAQSVFIPIIEVIKGSFGCFLIEEFFDGVSLYNLMQGQVYGTDKYPLDFAIQMYDMYQKNNSIFAKAVIKEILKGIIFIHERQIGITYIEPPENIVFTRSGEIKIRIISSLLYNCALYDPMRFTTLPEQWHVLLPSEFSPGYVFNEQLGRSSDVFTVGILLYCILTGHLPYKRGASLENRHRQRDHHIKIWGDDDNDKLTGFNDNLFVESHFPHHNNELFLDVLPFRGNELLLDEIEDKHLKKIVDKALRRDPEHRFQSVAEFINALDNYSLTIDNKKEHPNNNKSVITESAIGCATVSSKKFHLSYYYSRFRICNNCGEYVPNNDVCPACGGDEMDTIIADKYLCSNPRRCENCSYESWILHSCPKCGSDMKLIYPYVIGDFTSLGEHYPEVTYCSDDVEILELEEDYLSFDAFADITKKVNVICNYFDWYAQSSSSWISIQNKKSDYFEIAISPNMSKKERTAKIEIHCGDKMKVVSVFQSGLSFRQIKSMKNLRKYLNNCFLTLLQLFPCAYKKQ